MNKKELIEKAAAEYSDCDLKRESFKDGAEWMSEQNSWHDVSEEPEQGKLICIRTFIGYLTSWYVTPNTKDVFKRFGVRAWAYVSDLIK